MKLRAFFSIRLALVLAACEQTETVVVDKEDQASKQPI